MNRIDRLSAILIQLQSRRIVRASEIAERFEISLRTVYRDIRALEEAGIPIGAEPGKGYYLAEGYHLPPVMFTKDEAGALLIGAKLVNSLSDPSIYKPFNDALYKIRSVLGAGEKDLLDLLNAHIEVFSSVNREKENRDRHLLSEIQSVLGREAVVDIRYLSFSKNELTSRFIEPVGLCFYADNWHLIAFCRLRNDYRDFRVDRITRFVVTGRKFQLEKHAPLQHVMQQIITAENLHPVTIRFSNHAANQIREKRYYMGFISELKNTSHTEMNFVVHSFTYFAKWLLAFLDEAEVLAPERLKKLVGKYSQQLCDHHRK